MQAAPTFGLAAAATAAVPFWAPVCMKDRMPDTRLLPSCDKPPPPACEGAAAAALAASFPGPAPGASAGWEESSNWLPAG